MWYLLMLNPCTQVCQMQREQKQWKSHLANTTAKIIIIINNNNNGNKNNIFGSYFNLKQLRNFILSVSNNLIYTIIFFGQVSSLYDPCQVLYGYFYWTKFLHCMFILHCTIIYFEHFLQTFQYCKSEKISIMCTVNIHINQWVEWVFLTFEFTKALELSLTSCCVV